MTQPATKPLTFDEFQHLALEGRYELVDGRLEELVAPRPRHGWTGEQFSFEMVGYLRDREPAAYWGSEVDIPTIPFFGRRPDFVYYSVEDAARIDLQQNEVLGVPTLVVEVLSEDDEERDTVTKRREYAEAGIPHYWILDPRSRTMLTLILQDGAYTTAGEFLGEDVVNSGLFPGLAIPLQRLFR
jgi:Uma2 family endonuclease